MTVSGFVQVKEKLYELENTLHAHQFIRISKFVISNIYEMSKFEASFNGTLCVHFRVQKNTYRHT
ncbi:LytTR family transcriptional regulator DNA-binding domain-containing protein [Paenisporosarcina sp. OV554]|uniref:LytTR family transcriptional regulator DNA-binding domain-containing protein n=1 Tax=Paenisporosarcina sp. OV554 TaxID=2135694 RepID=UPI000D46ADFD|nr:LytTr DNA-binding domain-containing protein [Paenisporosarcina sp. OV554]